MQEIFKLAGLTHDKIFLDIGHGIGNGVLQAAYTCGCEARGIEIDPDRHIFAIIFEESIRRQANDTFNSEASERVIAKLREDYCQFQHEGTTKNQADTAASVTATTSLPAPATAPSASYQCASAPVPAPALPRERNNPGVVRLEQGNLRSSDHRDFLTSADVIFVNNAEGIFAARNEDKSNLLSLDSHISYLFALSRPGTVLVTLHPLTMLGQPLSKANALRKKRGLPEHPDASFFEYRQEIMKIGRREGLSWASERSKVDNKAADDFIIHFYTRTTQSSCTPFFLCGKPACMGSITPTVAVRSESNGSERLADACFYCGEKRLFSTRAYIKKPSRLGYDD